MRLFFLLIFCVLASCSVKDKDQIIGVKIYDYEGDLKGLFSEWNGIGINHAFISPELARKKGFMPLSKENNIKVFLIVPTFFKPVLLEKNPDLYAIQQDGSQAKKDWVQFVCPNRDDIKSLHMNYLKALVQDLNPNGISLDFMRYFVFWEKVFPDMTLDDLPQTCFDSVCVAKFSKDYSISIPQDLHDTKQIAGYILENHERKWVEFKCKTITNYVEEITSALRSMNPEIEINLHAVPWRSKDFGNAIQKVAGQDIKELAGIVDFVSPMCYSHMVKQTPEWIHDVTLEFENLAGKENILPSIQVGKAYLDEELSVEEFKECLIASLKKPSNGVIFWSWDALEKEPEKKQIISDLLKSMK